MALAGLSIDRSMQRPQSYASDGTDAIGFVQFWGLSPARDLLGEEGSLGSCSAGSAGAGGAAPSEPKTSEEAAAPGGYNILVSGGADIRHLLKTVTKLHEKTTGGSAPKKKLTFYLHDAQAEVTARHVLFLQIVNNQRLTPRERAELFLSLYGNSLVRERDAKYSFIMTNILRIRRVFLNTSYWYAGLRGRRSGFGSSRVSSQRRQIISAVATQISSPNTKKRHAELIPQIVLSEIQFQVCDGPSEGASGGRV